jgi:hypothetical protein
VKIRHHIAHRSDNPLWRDIQRLGLPVDSRNAIIWALDITEDDPSWPAIAAILAAHGEVSAQYFKVFSKQEENDADWLVACAAGHHGYPQPEDDYFELTYDSTSCPRCGIKGAQVNPFRFRAEPKAKHSHFLQLNWIFDELFVRHDAQLGIEGAGIRGIEFVPVVIDKSGEPSRAVRQMKVSYALPSSLNVARLQSFKCEPENQVDPLPRGQSLPYCNRVKYLLRTRAQFEFERSAFTRAPDMVKSHEWFGAGATAFRLIIVSQAFRQLMLANKWRGLHFEPIALVDRT